jgi:hypothetical protein
MPPAEVCLALNPGTRNWQFCRITARRAHHPAAALRQCNALRNIRVCDEMDAPVAPASQCAKTDLCMNTIS